MFKIISKKNTTSSDGMIDEDDEGFADEDNDGMA